MTSLSFKIIFCFLLLLVSNANAFIFSSEYGSDYKANSIEFLKGGSEYYVKIGILLEDDKYIHELYRLRDGSLLLKDKLIIDLASDSVVSVFEKEQNLTVVDRLEIKYEFGKGQSVAYHSRKIYFRLRTNCELFDKPFIQFTDINGNMLERMAFILDREFDYELPGRCFSDGVPKSFHVNGVSLSLSGLFDVGDGFLYAAISGYPIVLKLKITGNEIDLIFREDEKKSKLVTLKKGI